MERVAVYDLDLYKFLISITDNAQLAEDLKQDTMEKAWENIEQLKDPLKAKTWLFAIGKNVAFAYYRKFSTFDSYGEEVETENLDDLKFTEMKEDVLISLIRNFDTKIMARVLEMVDMQTKTLVVMRYYQKLSYKEMSDILLLNENTARVSTLRALKKIQELREQIERGEL